MLRGIDNASEYEVDIRIISIMKDDYELIEECVEDLDDEDCQLMKAFLVQRKFIKEMACESIKNMFLVAKPRNFTIFTAGKLSSLNKLL